MSEGHGSGTGSTVFVDVVVIIATNSERGIKARTRNFLEGNIFSRVCTSVYGRGGNLVPSHHGIGPASSQDLISPLTPPPPPTFQDLRTSLPSSEDLRTPPPFHNRVSYTSTSDQLKGVLDVLPKLWYLLITWWPMKTGVDWRKEGIRDWAKGGSCPAT